MDQLELLKQKWQSQEQDLPVLSYKDIYSMLLKKSSSIVKWIFIISIAELLLWAALSLFVPESSKRFMADMGIDDLMLVFTILNYVVVAVFLFLFYRNYTAIKTTDTIKNLMANILRTRKTVRYFVIYNVGSMILGLLCINVYFFLNQDKLQQALIHDYPNYEKIPMEQITSVYFIAQLIVGVIMVLLLLLFYRVIYGILLKRLKRNYRELKKIEV